MFKKISLSILVLMVVSSYAQEERWVKIYEDEESIIYIDNESIKTNYGGVKNSWFLTRYKKHKSTVKFILSDSGDRVEYSNVFYNGTKSYYEIFCKERKMNLLLDIFYKERSVVSQNDYKGYGIGELWDVVPDTIGESIWESVCS